MQKGRDTGWGGQATFQEQQALHCPVPDAPLARAAPAAENWRGGFGGSTGLFVPESLACRVLRNTCKQRSRRPLACP